MSLNRAFAFLLFLCCSLTAFAQVEQSVLANVSGSGSKNYIPKWTSSSALGNSALYQNVNGQIGIDTTSPTQRLEVDSGNFLVKGSNNFKSPGQDAFVYVGDTNHSVEAIYSGGLTLGAYLVPEAVYIADKTGYVGILNQSPDYILTLQEGGGDMIADGYTVYSSRRFKTNIHPLLGSLEKIEQLQGVSYVRKSNGKPEIGVVAEDAAKVVPELVSSDPKTGEVQGVDYARLSALLIEAVKSQQTEINQLKEQVQQLTSKK
jgi:Chaperone of endosialidase